MLVGGRGGEACVHSVEVTTGWLNPQAETIQVQRGYYSKRYGVAAAAAHAGHPSTQEAASLGYVARPCL